MNIERLLTMIFRRLAMRGVNKGINAMAQRGQPDPKDMTPEEREQARAARQTSKNARKMMRVGRRMGRF